MPFYHFRSTDSSGAAEEQRVELADDATAQSEASRFAGELLRDDPARIWNDGQWRIEVTDNDRTLLFTFISLAIAAPIGATRRAAAVRR